LNYQFRFFSYFLFFATIVEIYTALRLWPRRKARGALWLFFMEIFVAVWTFAVAFESAALTIPLKYLWCKISYLGNATAGPLFFLFAYEYARQRKFSKPRNIIPFFLGSLFFIIIVATNDHHHLHWTGLAIAPETNFGVYRHGQIFWLFIAYNYLLLMLGVIHLIRAFFQFSLIYRSQNIVLLIAASFPIVSNVLYVFNLTPVPGLDLTPPAFAFTVIMLGWSLQRFKMFQLVPFARNQIIDTMTDGLVIVDADNQIIDANPPIRMILSQEYKTVFGKNLSEYLPDNVVLRRRLQLSDEAFFEIALDTEKGLRHFEVHISPLSKPRENSGKSIIFHDITQWKQIEKERENLVHKLQTTMAEVKTLNGLLPICASCKKIRNDQGYWQNVEEYVHQHSGAEFSHGICPECLAKLYPEQYERIKKKKNRNGDHERPESAD